MAELFVGIAGKDGGDAEWVSVGRVDDVELDGAIAVNWRLGGGDTVATRATMIVRRGTVVLHFGLPDPNVAAALGQPPP